MSEWLQAPPVSGKLTRIEVLRRVGWLGAPGNFSAVLAVRTNMKPLYAAAGAALVACSMAAWGQTHAACGEFLNVPLESRSDLTIHAMPAGLEIVGTDKETLHVSCSADDEDRARDVRMRFSGGSSSGTLTVDGPMMRHQNMKIRVEVPRKTNLRVEMGAGQVNVDDVTGDKAIVLYAGQITIASSREWDYQRIDASVDIGEVNAAAWHIDKGGFFRSFQRKNEQGEYRLFAHVTTGEIDLVGSGGTAE